MIKRNLFITAVCLCLGGLALAQQSEVPDREAAVFETGFGYQMWKVQPNYDPITQITLPFSLVLPLGARTVVNVANTPAYSWWQGDRKIFGLSDTWMQMNYEVLRDRLILNAGLCLPTGKTRLDTNQYVLSKEMLSRNIYHYRLPLYGQGFSLKMGVMYALPLNEKAVFGVAGQYIQRSAYRPVVYDYEYKSLNGETLIGHWDAEYKPGNEATLQLGLDFLAAKNIRIALDALYTYYWRDLMAGEEVYGAGGKFSFNLDAYYRYALEKYIWAHAVYRMRGKNELLQGASFEPEPVNSNGAQFELDIEANVISDDQNGLRLLAVTRYYAKSKLDDAQSEMVFGAGVGASVTVGESSSLRMKFQYLFGGFDGTTSTRLAGLESYVGYRYSF